MNRHYVPLPVANAVHHVEIARRRAGALTSFGMRSELTGIQGLVVAAAEPYRLRRCAPLQCSGHGLDLSVAVQDLFAHFAAPARLLVAAKGQRRVEHVVAIDPHGPST
jgi:hypothetical protein